MLSRPMGKIADLEYAHTAGEPLRMDLYLPMTQQTVTPVVVWLHGGGWYTGTKENPLCLFLVERGYAVASIDYRLSGRAHFPAQIQDCKAAIRYLRANAALYGLDTKHIAAWGISAGGHLAALLGTATNTPEWDSVHGYQGYSSQIQAVVDFFGPTDFLARDAKALVKTRIDHSAPDSPEARLIGGAVHDNPEKVRVANPITYVAPETPPFLIVHGEQDAIVPVYQSLVLHGRLLEVGVSSTLHLLPDAGHGFKPQHRREVMPLVEAFLERHLKHS